MITNAICTSFKGELLSAGHAFESAGSVIITIANNATTTNSVSSMSGIAVGMAVTGTSIQNGTVVANTTTTALTLSKPVTNAITAGTVNIAADSFYIALLVANTTGTYNANTTNYSQVVSNGDEVANGNGYTTGGFLLTNMTAVTDNPSGTSYITFGTNPQWLSASFSYGGAIIYNASARIAGVSGRSVAVFNLGSQVSAGATITLTLPAATPSTALIRLN
jgi:hypothetical protein